MSETIATVAGPLNYSCPTKGKPMWVFNGEEWVDDDASEWSSPKKSEATPPRYEEMMPELQIIEIVRVPRNTDVPPLPMP